MKPRRVMLMVEVESSATVKSLKEAYHAAMCDRLHLQGKYGTRIIQVQANVIKVKK